MANEAEGTDVQSKSVVVPTSDSTTDNTTPGTSTKIVKGDGGDAEIQED